MLPWTIAVILGLMTILAFVFNFYKNREFYQLASKFPGPFSLPILGDAYLFLGNSEKIYKALYSLPEKFDATSVRIWLGPRLIICFYNPEDIKNILQNSATSEKDDLYSVMEPWLGSGLITAKGDVWKVHRKFIQPTFNQRILNSFVDIFQKHSLILTKKLEKEINGKEFDINQYLSISSLAIIRESAMGINEHEDENTNKTYVKALGKTLETANERVFKFWLQVDVIFKMTRLSKQFQESVKYLHNFTDKLIKSKREKINSDKKNEEGDSSKKMKPFLDLLMNLSDKEKILSDSELRNEVDTILFAGHDTTATTVSFTLLMLATHQDIQDKVYEEIYNLYGSKTPEEVPFASEHSQHLPYLEKVIKETMRLFPVAPFLLRKVSENFELGKNTVPKGSTVLIPVSNIHRDEKIWPEPCKFNPERFSSEESAKRHPYAYLPFSAGPRNCIGQTFAMMSMKSIVSTVLRKYIVKKDKIKPIENIGIKLDILLRSTEPITIRIEKRKILN